MRGKVIYRLLVAVSLVAVTGCSTDPTPSAPSMADLKQQVSADLVPGTPADCDGQDFVAGFVEAGGDAEKARHGIACWTTTGTDMYQLSLDETAGFSSALPKSEVIAVPCLHQTNYAAPLPAKCDGYLVVDGPQFSIVTVSFRYGLWQDGIHALYTAHMMGDGTSTATLDGLDGPTVFVVAYLDPRLQPSK